MEEFHEFRRKIYRDFVLNHLKQCQQEDIAESIYTSYIERKIPFHRIIIPHSDKYYEIERIFTNNSDYILMNKKYCWVPIESYDVKLKKMHKNYFQDFVFEELMRKVFHPKNTEKFEDWGFEL
jgi:hypothetical protein